MLGVGALCASWISYGTFVGFSDTNTAQWRLPLGIQIIPAVVLGALIFLFPESPRWLIDHGRDEQGLVSGTITRNFGCEAKNRSDCL